MAAADYGCNNGQSTGSSFYGPTGDAAAVTNYSDAWRFRAQRTTNDGTFYVGAFAVNGSLIQQNRAEIRYVWVGRWSDAYPVLAGSEKVTNYGPGSVFYYDRSCTRYP